MTVPTSLEIEIRFSPDVRSLTTEDEPHPKEPAEFKMFLHLGVDIPGGTPEPIVTLDELLADWFRWEDPRNEFWRKSQFAMEGLLEAQLQKLRARMIRSGIYPAQ